MRKYAHKLVPPQPNQWTAGRPAAHRLLRHTAQKTPQEKPRPEQKYPRDQRKIIRRIEARPAGQAETKTARCTAGAAAQTAAARQCPDIPSGRFAGTKTIQRKLWRRAALARGPKAAQQRAEQHGRPNQVQNAEQYLLRRHHQHRNGREQKSAAKCDRATAYRMLPIRKHSPRQQNERPTDELLPDMRVAVCVNHARRSAEYIDPVVNAMVYGHIYQCKTGARHRTPRFAAGRPTIFPARLYSTSVTHSAP